MSQNLTPLVFQEDMADSRDATVSRMSQFQPSARKRSTSKCVRAEKRDEASSSGSQPSTRQDWLSHTSLRQLQVLHSSKLTASTKDEVFLIRQRSSITVA